MLLVHGEVVRKRKSDRGTRTLSGSRNNGSCLRLDDMPAQMFRNLENIQITYKELNLYFAVESKHYNLNMIKTSISLISRSVNVSLTVYRD